MWRLVAGAYSCRSPATILKLQAEPLSILPNTDLSQTLKRGRFSPHRKAYVRERDASLTHSCNRLSFPFLIIVDVDVFSIHIPLFEVRPSISECGLLITFFSNRSVEARLHSNLPLYS